MDYQEIEARGEVIRIPIPRSYADCAELIRSDAYRHNGRKSSLLSIWLTGWTRISVGFSFWFRLAQHKGVLYPLCRWRLSRYKRNYGLFIPPKVRIGYGLYIQHCCSIIINHNAILGNNVHIGQLTSIGSNVGYAIIGDNVYIGPNTCLVDDVVVHSHSTIGAGAVVTRDVPSHTTVAGVPARVIKQEDHPEYLRNVWEIRESRRQGVKEIGRQGDD